MLQTQYPKMIKMKYLYIALTKAIKSNKFVEKLILNHIKIIYLIMKQ